MNPFISFFSGIIAAFTPCVIVMFPVVLYRFFQKEKRQLKLFGLFILGFILTYLVFGNVISALLSSSVQNGIRLGLGLMFAVLGILSVLNKINPLNFPVIKNPFLLGAVFSLIISVSPCSLPYLGVVISSSSSSAVLLTNMFFFGLGILSPSIVFAFAGQSILGTIKKKGKIFHHINKMMSFLLIGAGIYMMFTMKAVSYLDIYVVSGILVIIFIILIKSFFIINRKEDFFKLKNMILLASMLLIMTATIMHCNKNIPVEEDNEIFKEQNLSLPQEGGLKNNAPACESDITGCPICRRCMIIFSSSVLLAILGVVISSRIPSKKRKR